MDRISYSTVTGSKGAIAVLKVGNYLYTAGGDTLCVYDVSRADKPRLLRSLSGFGAGRQLAASNGKLYLTARNFGLWILSLQDPASPKRICRFDTIELATGIAVSGDFVFVTERIFGIEVIDCSDPFHPRHCSMIRTDEAQSACFSNGLLYAGEWGSGKLSVIDISNPYKPRIRSQHDLGGYGDGVAISGDICCAATGLNRKGLKDSTSSLHGDGHGLDVFHLSEDGEPRHLARLDFPVLNVKSNDFWSVAIAGKSAFVADTHNGVFQVDISTPEKPRCVGHIELPTVSRFDAREGGRVLISVPDCAGGVAIGNGVLYVVGEKSGLHLAKIGEADATQIRQPEPYKFLNGKRAIEAPSGFLSYELGGQVRRVSADEKNERLFVASSHAGIKILKLAGKDIQVIGEKAVKSSYDVLYRDGKLYSAEGTDGFAVYAVEGDTLRELGRFRRRSIIFQLIRLSGNGRFAVCGGRDGLLRFLDISDAGNIRMVRRHLHGGLLYGDTMPETDHNDIMPIIWPYSGITWYDFSGDKPKILYNDCKNRSAGQREGITWWNGYFLLSTAGKSFRLLNPADCGRTWTEIPDGCSGVPSANGNIIAFSNRRNGDLQVYRMTKSSAELIVDRSFSDISGTPDRVVFYHGRMIIPCGYQGLLTENAENRDWE